MNPSATERKMPRAKSVWLVTWEWTGDAAAVADEVAGVFPPQWSSDRVEKYVERLYALATSTVAELLTYARKPSSNPYRATEKGGRIVCGHHPWLEARLATDVVVEQTDDGFEQVSWSEPDRYEVDVTSGALVKQATGIRRTVTRRLRGPVSGEHIWDRAGGCFKPGWGPDE